MGDFDSGSEKIKGAGEEIQTKIQEHLPQVEAIKAALGIFESFQSGNIGEAMAALEKNQATFSELGIGPQRVTNQRLDMVQADKKYNFTIDEMVTYFKGLNPDVQQFIISQCK